jgi:hypothetical protein
VGKRDAGSPECELGRLWVLAEGPSRQEEECNGGDRSSNTEEPVGGVDAHGGGDGISDDEDDDEPLDFFVSCRVLKKTRIKSEEVREKTPKGNGTLD